MTTKYQLQVNHRRRWANPAYREHILTRNAEWDKTHPGNQAKRSLAWRNRNKAKARATERRWRTSKAGRAWTQARDHARRAAKLGVTYDASSIAHWILSIREKASVKCYYCGKRVAGHKAHFDHIIPLSKGGGHCIENLCVSCPPCNQTKLNKPIQDWLRLGQQILAL